MSLRTIGIIGKPHGIRGEVTVRWVTDYPKTFQKGDQLHVGDSGKQLTIESIRQKLAKGKTLTIIKFAELNNPQDAQKYRQAHLLRSQDEGPSLQENQYWLDDLAGCKVYVAGRQVGIVQQVLDLPANVVLVTAMEAKDPSSSVLIPFIETYIKQVDPKNKKIELRQLPQYI